ncbi:MAG: tetratricopeptide repeat protein [Pseudorhodobacter sp.]|nr:tetratricopeptide repeat protein [Pseudorhodobacter sp.]
MAQFFLRPVMVAALTLLTALPVKAQDQFDAGAYLAARIAGSRDDFREASNWYTRALIADPSNSGLMEGAVIAHIAAGNYEAALAVARRLQQSGAKSQPADLILIADQAKRGDFSAMIADLDAGRSVGMLLDGLVRAWAELGTGQMSDALEQFEKLAETKGLEAFGLYHKALALASVGDFEGAEAILSGKDNGTINVRRRGTIAHIQILSQLERNADALALLNRALPIDTDPVVAAYKAKLEAGETLPYDITRNVTDGIGEVFFTLSLALNGEASDSYTLLYSRITTWLRPDHFEAQLMSASLLENQLQYDLAAEAYGMVPRTDGGFFAAEIGRARALNGAGRLEASLEVLTTLARDTPELFSVHLALGDTLRRAERWPEASAAYDKAVALIPTAAANYWSVYFSRGISYERQGKWTEAEADFRKALELRPEEPQVLNYLGYSFLERGENFDEAIAMIETAVKARPDSGYIVDSFAWGLFLLGRYEESVEHMERASVLEPVDPIVTDHLGDVYWAVGRKLEASFQWRRALSFGPEEDDAERIRRKLEVGLDAVRAEEGEKPLSEVQNAN